MLRQRRATSILLNRPRLRPCPQRCPKHDPSRCGAASPAGSSTTRPRAGPRTASRPARAGKTSRRDGAAPSAERARRISKWWSFELTVATFRNPFRIWWLAFVLAGQKLFCPREWNKFEEARGEGASGGGKTTPAAEGGGAILPGQAASTSREAWRTPRTSRACA